MKDKIIQEAKLYSPLDKLRDQIAIEYMKDQLARGNDYLKNISKQAYLMADAMMEERGK